MVDDSMLPTMTDTVGDWLGLLDTLYPPREAETWDQPGLHVGSLRDPVTKVLATLDVTPAVIDEAVVHSADLIIAHHPLFFSPVQRLTPQTASGKTGLAAARAGVAVVAAHTNLDRAAYNTSHPAADAIGLTNRRPLEPLSDHRERGLGLVGDLQKPTDLRFLAATLADALAFSDLRFAIPPEHPGVAQRVAICGGSGGSLIETLMDVDGTPTVDLFITADLKHHVALDAVVSGLALIDAGHFATENPVMDAVVAELADRAPTVGLQAPIIRSTLVTDPWVSWHNEEKGMR